MITYNHAPYIAQAIEGVMMQQTISPIELIIGEDCSTDNTRSICKEYQIKYPDKIKLLLPDSNLGMMQNFINTLKTCSGNYIALCEGDDYWTDPYKLQKQIDILESEDHKEVMAVVTNSSVCDLNGSTIQLDRMVIPPSNAEGIYTLHDFFRYNHQYPTLTAVFRNKNNNLIVDNLKKMSNPFLGDWLLWVFLYQQGTFYFMNQITGAYRINPNSVTHTISVIKRWEADFEIRKKLMKLLPEEFHSYLKNNWYAYFQLSMAYRKNNNKVRFFYYQTCSFFSNPYQYIGRIITIIFKSKLKY